MGKTSKRCIGAVSQEKTAVCGGMRMEHIKKCPLFVVLMGTGLIFTLIGIVGKSNIYARQEYDPVTTPVLALMFRAVNDDIYPWQILDGESRQVMAVKDGQENSGTAMDGVAGGDADLTQSRDEALNGGEGNTAPENGQGDILAEDNGQKGNGTAGQGETESTVEIGARASSAPLADPQTDVWEDPSESAEAEGIDPPLERLDPLRESTYDEYINHISADIYGDAGAVRASAYKFDKVDESYFDDALFIGDSRTVGLRDYTDLSDHGDFYCETSLTIHKVMEEDFGGKGTIEDALKNKDYGKIYLMVGINELGRGTTEDYMEAYTEVVDKLRELEPDAKIFVQAVMRVSGEKSSADAIFNNNNINARNNAIATLADNRNIFYIDVNEAVCDEEGNLNEEYTHDKIHLLGMYNELWKGFLMEHGVRDKE